MKKILRLNDYTQCSSRHEPSEIIGSMVKELPALATPTALLSKKNWKIEKQSN